VNGGNQSDAAHVAKRMRAEDGGALPIGRETLSGPPNPYNNSQPPQSRDLSSGNPFIGRPSLPPTPSQSGNKITSTPAKDQKTSMQAVQVAAAAIGGPLGMNAAPSVDQSHHSGAGSANSPVTGSGDLKRKHQSGAGAPQPINQRSSTPTPSGISGTKAVC
jgi:hypothetical protein